MNSGDSVVVQIRLAGVPIHTVRAYRTRIEARVGPGVYYPTEKDLEKAFPKTAGYSLRIKPL